MSEAYARRGARVILALAVMTALALVLAVRAPLASADAPSEASWRLEQPSPPSGPPGSPGSESRVPIGLGRIGDMEFWAPNRGLLITAGNPPTIPPGVWAYNGQQWHELATVCGASEGRIAWAGPEEFWTISDGRPGQVEAGTGVLPPLEDNTLCRFAGGQVVASYAHPAFQADSYQPMHAAGCISPSDCWFAGDQLPEPQIGAFQLHWNGGTLQAEPYPDEGHAIEDMRAYQGHLYETVRVTENDRDAEGLSEVPLIHRINPEGIRPPFVPELEVPLDGTEAPNPIDFLHLSAADGALWGAAASYKTGGEGAQVTVVRRAGGNWSQVLGPATQPSGAETFPLREEVVDAIAAEPATESAWLALDSHADAFQPDPAAPALVARISAAGKLLEEQTLPAPGGGAKGGAARLACPAENDCWLATTQGWLYHLAPEAQRTLPPDEDPAFAGPITYRPPDQGLPQIPPDAPPADDSGLGEAPPPYGTLLPEGQKPESEAKVRLPLLSRLHSRLVHRTTLELRFHLAVRARVRLIAKRHRRIVASTPVRTLAAGERHLLLRLDPRSWPTKLAMQTHALAPLPTAPPREEGAGPSVVSTGLVALPGTPSTGVLSGAPFGSGSGFSS